MGFHIPPAILFMKVGYHSGETLIEIMERKHQEEVISGTMFRGYGGTLCHPTSVVRPFAALRESMGITITVALATTPSKFHAQSPSDAIEFSTDGLSWQPLPGGITVKDSRYALVMRDLCPRNVKLDLNSYLVGSGPSRGKRLGTFIRSHIDKGLGVLSEPNGEEHPVLISFTAQLVKPYAVFVR